MKGLGWVITFVLFALAAGAALILVLTRPDPNIAVKNAMATAQATAEARNNAQAMAIAAAQKSADEAKTAAQAIKVPDIAPLQKSIDDTNAKVSAIKVPDISSLASKSDLDKITTAVGKLSDQVTRVISRTDTLYDSLGRVQNQMRTITSTMSPTATGVFSSTGATTTTLQNTVKMGQWTVKYFTGTTTLMKSFVFTNTIAGWSEFPNVDWPAGKFLAKNGLEYGQELSDFCQQDKTCDFPVAARSYRTITADYDIGGIGNCKEISSTGCALILVNMGDVTASFRNQKVDTGHTITGLYWNGNTVDQAISAWSSHIVYRMVGVPGNNPANPGANCSSPNGCKGVNITFAILSGNELLMLGNSVVTP